MKISLTVDHLILQNQSQKIPILVSFSFKCQSRVSVNSTAWRPWQTPMCPILSIKVVGTKYIQISGTCWEPYPILVTQEYHECWEHPRIQHRLASTVLDTPLEILEILPKLIQLPTCQKNMVWLPALQCQVC